MADKKSEKKHETQQLIAVGDVWLDNLLVPVRGENCTDGDIDWERSGDRFRSYRLPGGALLMRDLLRDIPGEEKNIKVVSYEYNVQRGTGKTQMIHTLGLGKPEKGDICNGNYFIEKRLGYPESGLKTGVPLLVRDFAAGLPVQEGTEGAIIAMEDAGHGFRNEKTAWENVLRRAERDKKGTVIYNMAPPLFTGELWEQLAESGLLKRTVVIIDADALRTEGVNISKNMSWDRTIADMVTLPAYKKYGAMKKCKHLLIRFGLEGVLHYHRTGNEAGYDGGKQTRMIYLPPNCEGEILGSLPGMVNGLKSVFAGFLAMHLVRNGQGGENWEARMPEAVKWSVEKTIQLATRGYGRVKNKMGFPFAKVMTVPASKTFKWIEINEHEMGYLEGNRKKWSILSHRIPRDFDLYETAHDYVIKGNVKKLDDVPVVEFGKLLTIDKNEIESFRSIKNLTAQYVGERSETKPISIAVFGPPGSGKSFAVKSVVKTVMGKDTEILEFNLSQFDSPHDLVRAFQRVRDFSLRGIVPLVFFDEFDSAYGTQALGWLKYFLAPMQDGEFREGERSHPIGRAVFVFAGGTHSSLSSFAMANDSAGKENEAMRRGFVSAKGPDFVSRLKGYVDILGPNPIDPETRRDTAPRFDRFAVIRRAVLLRVLLTQNKNILTNNGEIRIDEDVLRALLLIPKYKHGARSISAIIAMSTLNGKRRFDKSSLPSPEQLSLHVEPDVFMNILERDLIIEKAVIHQQIHEVYRKTQEKMDIPKPPNHPSMADWDKLGEDLKQNNRMLAENIPLKLLLVNCSYRPKTEHAEKEPPPVAFSEDEIDYLARMAHEKWLEKKISEGWVYGKPRDDSQKKHDCIVPWEYLPEELKMIDKTTIQSIPHMFDTAGFKVYRL